MDVDTSDVVMTDGTDAAARSSARLIGRDGLERTDVGFTIREYLIHEMKDTFAHQNTYDLALFPKAHRHCLMCGLQCSAGCICGRCGVHAVCPNCKESQLVADLHRAYCTEPGRGALSVLGIGNSQSSRHLFTSSGVGVEEKQALRFAANFDIMFADALVDVYQISRIVNESSLAALPDYQSPSKPDALGRGSAQVKLSYSVASLTMAALAVMSQTPKATTYSGMQRIASLVPLGAIDDGIVNAQSRDCILRLLDMSNRLIGRGTLSDVAMADVLARGTPPVSSSVNTNSSWWKLWKNWMATKVYSGLLAGGNIAQDVIHPKIEVIFAGAFTVVKGIARGVPAIDDCRTEIRKRFYMLHSLNVSLLEVCRSGTDRSDVMREVVSSMINNVCEIVSKMSNSVRELARLISNTPDGSKWRGPTGVVTDALTNIIGVSSKAPTWAIRARELTLSGASHIVYGDISQLLEFVACDMLSVVVPLRALLMSYALNYSPLAVNRCIELTGVLCANVPRMTTIGSMLSHMMRTVDCTVRAPTVSYPHMMADVDPLGQVSTSNPSKYDAMVIAFNKAIEATMLEYTRKNADSGAEEKFSARLMPKPMTEFGNAFSALRFEDADRAINGSDGMAAMDTADSDTDADNLTEAHHEIAKVFGHVYSPLQEKLESAFALAVHVLTNQATYPYGSHYEYLRAVSPVFPLIGLLGCSDLRSPEKLTALVKVVQAVMDSCIGTPISAEDATAMVMHSPWQLLELVGVDRNSIDVCCVNAAMLCTISAYAATSRVENTVALKLWMTRNNYPVTIPAGDANVPLLRLFDCLLCCYERDRPVWEKFLAIPMSRDRRGVIETLESNAVKTDDPKVRARFVKTKAFKFANDRRASVVSRLLRLIVPVMLQPPERKTAIAEFMHDALSNEHNTATRDLYSSVISVADVIPPVTPLQAIDQVMCSVMNELFTPRWTIINMVSSIEREWNTVEPIVLPAPEYGMMLTSTQVRRILHYLLNGSHDYAVITCTDVGYAVAALIEVAEDMARVGANVRHLVVELPGHFVAATLEIVSESQWEMRIYDSLPRTDASTATQFGGLVEMITMMYQARGDAGFTFNVSAAAPFVLQTAGASAALSNSCGVIAAYVLYRLHENKAMTSGSVPSNIIEIISFLRQVGQYYHDFIPGDAPNYKISL